MVKSANLVYNSNTRRKTMIPTYRVIIHPDKEGGYWAECPEIQGCLTEGETIREIETNMFEAVDVSIPDVFPDISDYFLAFEVCDA